jgi:phospholipase/lecithinase/hemolysin
VTALTIAFNNLLAGTENALEHSLSGLDIRPFDTFSAFNELLASAPALGFSNTTDGCYLLGAACDPSRFVFWDSVHPTSAVHAILGAQFASAVVSEPGVLALFALGLLAIAWQRRRGAKPR